MKKPKHMTPAQLKTIINLTESGTAPYRISKIMKVPPAVVRYHVRKYKQSLSPIVDTPKHLEGYHSYVAENESLKRMNKKLLEIVLTQLQ